MLQLSTTDSEFNLFPSQELSLTPVSALSAEDEAFYQSIKEKLDRISVEPSQPIVDKILNYSKSV